MRTDFGALLRLLEQLRSHHASPGTHRFPDSQFLRSTHRPASAAPGRFAMLPATANRRILNSNLRRPSRRDLAG